MKSKLKDLVFDSLIEEPDFAIGNDLVFLPDFEASFNSLFQKKVYTQQEIDYCDQFEQRILRYASTWAAKEAVYKAIKQINPKPIGFKKIEIIRAGISGMPCVNLPATFADLKIRLTITHDADYIWSLALVRKFPND